MMKRVLTVLLAALLLLSLAVPALAENRNGVYILDEKEYLSEFEYQFYHNQASALSEQLNMDILYVQTYHTDLQNDAQSLNLGSRPDQIMLLDNDGTCDIALFGKAKALTQDHIRQLLDAYTIEPTYPEGVAAYLAVAEQLVTKLNNSGVFDEPTVAAPRLVDQAALLDPEEATLLQEQLDRISRQNLFDLVIVTANSLDGKSPMDYADDFFDDNGYGFGEDRDGILLLVSMQERELWISTSGYGIKAFTDAGIEYMIGSISSWLSMEDYAIAFDTFVQLSLDFLAQAETGVPYDTGNLPKEEFSVLASLFVSVIIGAVVAGIVILVLKGQLKSVRAQSGAAAYTKTVAPVLTVNREIYLYSTVSKRPKPKPSSSGGSSVHSSSSGRTHGGGGGKF